MYLGAVVLTVYIGRGVSLSILCTMAQPAIESSCIGWVLRKEELEER